ncbi:hypothetical protein IMZ29_07000 [Achromobacter sp. GG226]|uniref:hypothetical protein n=1 Tax=Verticiella alkaliphila TaxID=2779529 RepID=UPI001C0E0F9A|nr:hypothetical protein [Verticiella sp. GG226]MBU4610294.1 hypothetical protein [Verticiella sp. GG226]
MKTPSLLAPLDQALSGCTYDQARATILACPDTTYRLRAWIRDAQELEPLEAIVEAEILLLLQRTRLRDLSRGLASIRTEETQ